MAGSKLVLTRTAELHRRDVERRTSLVAALEVVVAFSVVAFSTEP